MYFLLNQSINNNLVIYVEVSHLRRVNRNIESHRNVCERFYIIKIKMTRNKFECRLYEPLGENRWGEGGFLTYIIGSLSCRGSVWTQLRTNRKLE